MPGYSHVVVLPFAMFICAVSPRVPAYEVATHAALTREAFMSSRLGGHASPLLVRLGLERIALDAGQVYLEDEMGGRAIRLADPPNPLGYISDVFKEANRRTFQSAPALPTLPAWTMLGAVREDDLIFDSGLEENTPQDDPVGPFARVLNHFFDPYRARPLSATVDLGTRADQWAITGNPATGGPAKGRSNSFSLVRAREATWRALTLKQWPPVGDLLLDLDLSSLEHKLTREAIRRAYWATTFRSIGDAVHLLQDMAQPQHTRNDAHSGMFCAGSGCIGGHASVYEKYVDARIAKKTTFRLRERFYSQMGVDNIEAQLDDVPIDFGAYRLPRFSRFQDYFATTVYLDSVNGKGLANYSNRGFYTVGTNVASPESAAYPSPSASPNGLPYLVLPNGSENLENAEGQPLSLGSLRLYLGTVRDMQAPDQSADLVRLSSYGMYDQFLKDRQKEPKFTLTHYNYRDQARLLIPRAVAYSAGMIDYFFRGRMEIRLPDEGVYALVDHQQAGCKDNCGFRDLKLKLKNKTNAGTDAEPIPEALGPGTLVAVVQFRRNHCYTDATLSGDPGGSAFTGNSCRSAGEEIVVSNPVSLGRLDFDEERAIPFKFKGPIPINASDVVLQVAFRGKMGQEDDAVAVETKDISEPNHLAISNSSDGVFDDLGDKRYHAVPYAGIAGPAILKSLKVSFGANAPTVACLAQLGGAEHAQVAFLTDRGAVVARVLVATWWTIDNPVVDFTWDDSRSEYRRSAPMIANRGWNRDNLLNLSWTTLGGGKLSAATCDAGDGGVCDDSALPTLRTENMKRWGIADTLGGTGCAS